MLSIYSAVLIVSVNKLWKSLHTSRNRMLFVFCYFALLTFQITQHSNTAHQFASVPLFLLSNKVLLTLIVLSLFIYFYLFNIQDNFYPAYKNPYVVANATVKLLHKKSRHYMALFEENREKMNAHNLKYIMAEIPRHRYLSYTSQNNLPQEYFDLCEKSIAEDNHLYIILSRTGSPASEIISVFTQKEYNHASLSFDRELNTIISYNGGDSFQQPGLNFEDISTFYQKDDSSMIVYSLQSTKKQRQQILNKIKAINEEGSAYNLIGLVTRVSIKPNIMFCSQFVYLMLKEVELHYFKSSQTNVKPTDFVEKDYYRKLQFEYEINFSELIDNNRF